MKTFISGILLLLGLGVEAIAATSQTVPQFSITSSNNTVLLVTNAAGLILDLTAVVPASTNSGNWQAVGTNSANLAPSGGTATMPFAAVGTNRVGQLISTNGPLFDVRAYGAVGSPTDDTAAFKAACDAAGAVGGTVYAPANTYVINALLITNSNIRIVGDGWNYVVGNGTVLKSTGTNAVVIVGDDSALPANNEFENVVFDGGTLTPSTWSVKVQGGASKITFRNCAFNNGAGQCLVRGGTNQPIEFIWFIECLFHSGGTIVGQDGLFVGMPAAGSKWTTTVYLLNSTFKWQTEGHAITVDGTDLIMNDTYADVTALHGVLLQNTTTNVNAVRPSLQMLGSSIDGFGAAGACVEVTDNGSLYPSDYVWGSGVVIDRPIKMSDGISYTNSVKANVSPAYSLMHRPIVQEAAYFNPDGNNNFNLAADRILCQTNGVFSIDLLLAGNAFTIRDHNNAARLNVFDAGGIELRPQNGNTYLIGTTPELLLQESGGSTSSVLQQDASGNLNISGYSNVVVKTVTGGAQGMTVYPSRSVAIGWAPSDAGSTAVSILSNIVQIIAGGGVTLTPDNGLVTARHSTAPEIVLTRTTNNKHITLRVDSSDNGELFTDNDLYLKSDNGVYENFHGYATGGVRIGDGGGDPGLGTVDIRTNLIVRGSISQGSTPILTAGQHLTNIADLASSTAVAQVLSGTNTEFIGGGTFDNIKSTNAVDAASYTLGGSAFVATGGGNVNLTGHLVEGTVDITTLTSGSLVNTNAITTGSLAAITNVTTAALTVTNTATVSEVDAATAKIGTLTVTNAVSTLTVTTANLATANDGTLNVTNAATVGSLAAITNVTSAAIVGTNSVTSGAFVIKQASLTQGVSPLANSTNQTLDFSQGMYQIWTMTNDVCLNAFSGSPSAATIKFRPNGANRNVLIDTNWMPVNVQGGTLNGTFYQFVVTNGTTFSMLSAWASGANATNVAAVWANF